MSERWPNFEPAEFTCRCGCGTAKMHEGFLDALQVVRTRIGIPMVIASGYRCPEHNAKVSTTGHDGPHTTGKAADIAIHGESALTLVQAAASVFTGIGIKQHGAHESRFVHLDLIEGPSRPAFWTYP